MKSIAAAPASLLRNDRELLSHTNSDQSQSVLFVWLVTIANLRGARESGTLFAIPTYGFVGAIMLMIALGLVRCLGGCPATPAVEPIANAATAATAIGLFAVLKAVAGEVGSARVVAAAPRIALAAGYDVEAALE